MSHDTVELWHDGLGVAKVFPASAVPIVAASGWYRRPEPTPAPESEPDPDDTAVDTTADAPAAKRTTRTKE